MNKKEFLEYCWMFYGPQQIYGDFFGHALKKSLLSKAIDLRMMNPAYEGDSVDREAVRDILMASFGLTGKKAAA